MGYTEVRMMSIEEYLELQFQRAGRELARIHSSSGSATDVGLVFPLYRDKTLRVSEQEAKVLFLYNVLTDHRFRVAVEKPTEARFRFTGTGTRSAQVDVALFGSGYDAEALIEFKADNRSTGIQKDLEKLISEQKTAGWFHTLGAADRGTLPSVAAKFKNAFAELRVHLDGAKSHECLFTFCIIVNRVLLYRWLPLGGTGAFDSLIVGFDDLSLHSRFWTKQVLEPTSVRGELPPELIVEETDCA
jgi:hypothetical protein